MKFNQVNKEQIRQANEAVETIVKLRRILATQRLIKRAFGQYFIEFKQA